MLTPEEELMSRSGCDAPDETELAAEDYPPLDPEEHAWIERQVGVKLTNEQAQLALREATVTAAWKRWVRP